METTAALTVSGIVGLVGDIFAEVITWMQTIAAVIVGGTVDGVTYEPNNLLLFMILFGFIFAGVSLFRRLLNL